MAPQKQAKRSRQAVSVKKDAGHGNNRSRAKVSAQVPVTNPVTRTSNARVAAAMAGAEAVSADPPASLGRRIGGWIRGNPLPFTTWILSIIGLGVSIYLTITHYDTNVTLFCADKGLINCAKVTSSSQSMVFGILPVAVLGLAFYVFMVVVNSPLGWRYNTARLPWLRLEVRWLRLGSIVVGMGFVIYLVYAELIQIQNICLYCTSVHVVTFLIFTLLVYDASGWSSSPQVRR